MKLPRALIWGSTPRIGFAIHGAVAVELHRKPTIHVLEHGADRPLAYSSLWYSPSLEVRLRWDRRIQHELTPAERTACDRLLDAVSRAPAALLAGDRDALLALMRLIGPGDQA